MEQRRRGAAEGLQDSDGTGINLGATQFDDAHRFESADVSILVLSDWETRR